MKTDAEAHLTVEDWQDLAMHVHAAARGVTNTSDLARLHRLRQKCVARAKALQEGRVMP